MGTMQRADFHVFMVAKGGLTRYNGGRIQRMRGPDAGI
ncbi:hypothetical protein THTE_4336 [Thermogutta terrifontis]|uniref:Uncharacterized protein n=1 Tax=Thermogutta terrifontis TaxID=1331910 RepID=A0A286RM15_9BACT|nr:hypothetical protein THTE_4336 [Thermogutta terrifontis]